MWKMGSFFGKEYVYFQPAGVTRGFILLFKHALYITDAGLALM